MVLLAIAGLIVYGLVFLDIIITAFSANGAGFLTSKISHIVWHAWLFGSRKLKAPGLLNYAGMVVVCSVLLLWLLLIWGANILIVFSDPYSVLQSQTKVPASGWEKVYFTGYVISSLGNGDYIGGSAGWKVYIALSSFTGIIAITLSISYLVPVLSAVTGKRQLSLYISSLGQTPLQILLNGWNGKDFSRLETHLQSLSSQILSLSENHLSHPVLHFFYTADRDKASVLSIVKLDEALSILYGYVAEEKRPDPLTLQVARKSIDAFLQNLNSQMTPPAATAPPEPNLQLLEQKGIPLLQQENMADKEDLQERRKLLLGLLIYEGRNWQSVYADA